MADTIHTDEELIKYGWDQDVWFHVDNLSSAHIYVRLPEGQDWESIDQGLLTDCAQLTKANSIEGTLLVPMHLLKDIELQRMLMRSSREQEGQRHYHIHAMVESEEGWQHGRRPSGFQRPAQSQTHPR